MRIIRHSAWLGIVLGTVAVALLAISGVVWYVDPYFVYRAPRTDRFYYVLDDGRWQNPGIMKRFDFDMLMVGSSMTENFRASDLSRAFGRRALRLSYSGGSFAEYRDAVLWGTAVNTNLSLVVVSLDMSKLLQPKNWRPVEASGIESSFDHLNVCAQLRYLLHADAIAKSFVALRQDSRPGITDFDSYRRWWRDDTQHGRRVVMRNYSYAGKERRQLDYTEELSRQVQESIEANILPMIRASRQVMFFIPPYSLMQRYLWKIGGLEQQMLEAERQYMQEILRHGNARIFSWNDKVELVGDLSNYTDCAHYTAEVNESMILWMVRGEGEITRENLDAYFDRLSKIIGTFDYRSFFHSSD